MDKPKKQKPEGQVDQKRLYTGYQDVSQSGAIGITATPNLDRDLVPQHFTRLPD